MRCELHLVRRRGELEGHGEHQGDGAEGLQPLGPLAGGAPASTPTWSLDGRRLASSGPLSRSRAGSSAAADWIAGICGPTACRESPWRSDRVTLAAARGAPRRHRGRCEKMNVLSAF